MLNLGAGLKLLLGLLVGAAAAAGAVYVAPQFLGPREAAVSEPAALMQPDTAATPSTDAASDTAADDGSEDQAPEADGEGAEVASLASDWVIPRFDVLRVEPDGSTVIAGKAEPGTTLDIMNGETVIASTMVGPSGDFAAVLDTPLSAGDYQLTLRIVDENGAMRNSEEVATVSIPENENGELLAMVSRPGKASRIIAQPSAAPPADPEPAAPQTAEPDAPTDAAASETVAASDGAAGNPASGNGETAAELAAVEIETPELPEMSSTLTSSAPEISGEAASAEPDAAVATEDAVAIADAPAAEEPAGTEIAAVSPEVAETTAVRELPADINVRVDAIEIEGDRIFIAGSATPGYPVKVSADGAVIGTATADESGRYIIEAQARLSVGDHIINADLLDEATGTVLLRATVPFNRPEGEALAAVSPEPSANAKTSRVTSSGETGSAGTDGQDGAPALREAAGSGAGEDTPGELILPDIASLSQMREDAFDALAALEQMLSGSQAPDREKLNAARQVAVEKLKAAAMADLPADSGPEALAIARSMRAQAVAALAVVAPATQDGRADDGGDPEAMREVFSQARNALSRPAEVALGDIGGETSGGGPRTIEQAPLASTPGAVIIRRGDTLWRISRRTYGQGVRYTTIYLANRSQIENPDRIQPGQVFSVPDTPLENAEELHRERLETERNR